MSGINTCGIIASMTNTKMYGNFSVSYNPNNSMSFVVSFIKPELTIPIFIKIRSPQPTTISFINFIPESFHFNTISQILGDVNATS